MKKRISALTLFLCLFSMVGFAQSRVTSRAPVNHNLEGGSDASNNGFGIKAGLNYASIHGDNKDDFSFDQARKSYHAGAYTQFSITPKFSIQPEVLYSRKGFEADSSVLKFDYIDVPLLLVYNFFDNVSVHVGPQASLLMTVKQDDREIDKADWYQSLDYGVVGGLEAKFMIFRVGARYNYGLREIYKDNFTDINNRVINDVKNGVFQVYLGVGFNN